MSRRKGERPIVHEPIVWSENCGIARMIRAGDRWYHAWVVQQCLSRPKLIRLSGISHTRLDEIAAGEAPTPEEVIALAKPFRTDPASLQASIDFASGARGTSKRFPRLS